MAISNVEWVLNGTGTVAVMGNTENLSYTLPASVTAGDYTIHVGYHVAGSDYAYDCEKEIPLTVTSTEPVVPTGVIFANIVGNNNVCEDDIVTLTAMVTGDATLVTNYVWLYQENPVATGPVYTFQPSVLFGTNTDHKIKLEVAYGDCATPAVDSIIFNWPVTPDVEDIAALL